MFDGVTFSNEEIQQAKEICALHNRKLPAIKELRAKLNLGGLYEAKQLCDDLWSSVEHPENVEYDFLGRVAAKPVVAHSYSLRIEGSYLYVMGQPNSGTVTVKLNKTQLQSLKDFGVPSI